MVDVFPPSFKERGDLIMILYITEFETKKGKYNVHAVISDNGTVVGEASYPSSLQDKMVAEQIEIIKSKYGIPQNSVITERRSCGKA